MKKKTIIIIIAAVIIIAVAVFGVFMLKNDGGILTESSKDEFVISGETISANAGDQAEMKLKVKGNPGVAYIRITIETDEKIVLSEAINGRVFETLDQGKNLLWSADNNSKKNGLLATLKFNLAPNIPAGEYPITICLRECYNEQLENVGAVIENGTIKVIENGGSYEN